MQRRHLRQVLRVDERAYVKPWPRSLFVSELSRPHDRAYLVARRGGVHVGHAGAILIEDEAHITTVVVDPSHQGGGLGTQLFWVLMRHLVDRGADTGTLEVRVGNTAAQRMYQRFGFAPAGVRKGYYADDGGADALVMWAEELQAGAYRDRLEAVAGTFARPPAVDPALEPTLADDPMEAL
ncbi:MAG: ribosomal protein S18-alanine N-acetyltransferase [Acidimicrobiales bacterium]|nr:ribosomal protein S18-alanine N-acetyltransferase [Acidimicrobiales bacterium]